MALKDNEVWKAVKPFMNGGLSGMGATCVIQPLDIVKVRLRSIERASDRSIGHKTSPFRRAASAVRASARASPPLLRLPAASPPPRIDRARDAEAPATRGDARRRAPPRGDAATAPPKRRAVFIAHRFPPRSRVLTVSPAPPARRPPSKQSPPQVRLQLGSTGGPFGVAAGIIKNEGFGALYTGLSAGLLRQARPTRSQSSSHWSPYDRVRS
jgi:hypothetical protein